MFSPTTLRRSLMGFVALCLIIGGSLWTTPPATAATSVPTILIVATHTDDESTLTAYFTGKPTERKVFLWVDQTVGGSNTQLIPGTNTPNRWNAGEYKPAGNLSSDLSRSNGKFEGSLRNIQALRRADASLPVMTYARPTKVFRDGSRSVMTWIDSARGGAIRYGLPAAQVTPAATRAAINDVTLNPGKYGLPRNTRWTTMLAPSYYNWSGMGGASCDTYASPYHRAVNEGVMLYRYPQFSGLKMMAVCKADKSARKMTKTPSRAVVNITHAYRGSLNVYFGWLYRGYGVPLMTSKSGVFSTTQTVIWSYANSGK